MNRFFSPSILALTLWLTNGASLRSESFVFTTIAGLAGSSGGVDGTNSNARFNRPSGVALDGAGNLYVSETLNHTIRRIAPAGTNWVVSTVAGLAGSLGSADGTNGDARFNRPSGLALDAGGNLYVTDNYNHTIRQITPLGTNWVVSTIAGLAGVKGFEDGTNDLARFNDPQAIALDSSRHLYIADRLYNTIREISPEGTNWVTVTIAGLASVYGGLVDGLNGNAEFSLPFGITRDGGGNLYVADFGNNAIRSIAPIGPDWSTTTVTGFSGLVGTNDGPSSVAMFNAPNGITIDSGGNLLVADQSNNTIRKIAPDIGGWTVSTIGGVPKLTGTNDGPGAVAMFNKPWGIAVNSAGTLFVADSFNNTIRMGVPIVSTPPTLQILSAGGLIVISWPSTATNYTLETSGTVNAVAPWTPLTSGISVSGTHCVLTNSPGAGTAFYRLHQH